MTRARTRLRGLLAALALLAIIAGLPMALLAVGASPVPASMPTLDTIKSALSSQDDGTLAFGFIKVAAWVAWAFLTCSIILELLGRVRGIRVPRMPGLRLPQSAARALVSTAMLLFIAAPLAVRVPPVAAAAPIPAAMAPAVISARTPAVGHHQTSSTPTTGRFSSPAEVARSTPTAGTPPAKLTHTVARGETLWSIANDHLGAGYRYPQIAALNPDLLGRRPGFLRPGWVLNLPVGHQRSQTGGHTVTVHRGQTLTEIAKEQLGDPARYPEIFAASQATTQPGGAHLRDPDVIDVGWRLTIPTTTDTATTANSFEPKPAQIDPRPGRRQPVEHLHGAPTPHPSALAPHPAASRPAPTATALATPAPAPATLAPATSTPSTSSTARVDRGQAHSSAGQSQNPQGGAPVVESSSPPWMLEGLTGAGTVLAGSMLLMLRRRRRAQFRARRPGRTIAVPEPVLAPVEKTLTASGSQSAPTIELIDAVLRRLATRLATASQDTPNTFPKDMPKDMPDLGAVELTGGGIVLHLSHPHDLPAPWHGSQDRKRWTCPAGVDIEEVGPDDCDQPAPYPLLVTIGAGDDGHVWLLNCEDLPVITITGDPTYGQDFARYMVAELACNPWSSEVAVGCVGIAAEIAPMNPQRVRYHDAGEDVAADVLLDALATIQRAATTGRPVTTARAAQLGDDTWPSRLLLVDAASPPTPALTQLLDLVSEHPGRTGTCVILTGEPADTHGIVLEVSAGGRVSIPHAGLDLVAVGLTSDEAQGCSALLAQSEDLADVPIPADGSAAGWRSFTNAAGALRTEHTLPRNTHAEDLNEPTESVLDGPDAEYLRKGATTAEDLDALAPQVTARVRAQIEDADPSLDADLEAWFADDCDLPRLTLLGPVGARTRGSAIAVARRKPYFTEILAYLGTHPNGVTPAKLADALGITPSRARTDIMPVRDWLGVNPRTGQLHLPHARDTQAAKTQGAGVYQVEGLLIDADLFRRLRVRGQARGPAGIPDLRAALTLVTGQPFDQLRTSGWSWLHEGDRLDQHMLCAIVDVAHAVTTAALKDGDLAQARAAAELAARVGPDEETPRLDLAVVATAEGHHHEAERIVREDVCNRSDDGQAPMDLSERTEHIIATHDWLTPEEAAS